MFSRHHKVRFNFRKMIRNATLCTAWDIQAILEVCEACTSDHSSHVTEQRLTWFMRTRQNRKHVPKVATTTVFTSNWHKRHDSSARRRGCLPSRNASGAAAILFSIVVRQISDLNQTAVAGSRRFD